MPAIYHEPSIKDVRIHKMKNVARKITYKVYSSITSPEKDQAITTYQFIRLLEKSTLAERRPVDDKECLEGMLKNSDLIVSAWEGTKLIGISRCITDFHYCCYLSDLAVDQAYQGEGIGKALQEKTQSQLGPKCKLILIAAPAANSYYQKIGFSNNPRCWVLNRDESIE